MRKSGLALVELLGAVVIFGLILSLSAMILSTITKANARIVEQSQANTEMTLLTSLLDDTYQDFGATNYVPCIGATNCIVFINAFEYVVNLENETIDLVVHNPALQLQLSLENNRLYIDNTLININHFTLASDSTITYEIIGDELILNLNLNFVGELNTYTYHYEQTLTLETIPT
jgi:hypothetical protein